MMNHSSQRSSIILFFEGDNLAWNKCISSSSGNASQGGADLHGDGRSIRILVDSIRVRAPVSGIQLKLIGILLLVETIIRPGKHELLHQSDHLWIHVEADERRSGNGNIDTFKRDNYKNISCNQMTRHMAM